MRRLEDIGVKARSAVTLQMIETVEERLRVQLPNSYKQFVLFNDAAEPEVSVFEFGNDATAVSEFLQFSADESLRNGVIRYATAEVPGVPAGVIPIARDAGDYLICLDLRNRGERVVVIDPTSECM